ncbi:RTX toxins [Vibrio sp. JCM 19236]|nr:RTX toxins [Vibrio sp. JCM 19236]
MTENDGDTEIFEGDIIIKVKPVIDAEVSYTGSATGNEDEFILVDWKPTGADFPDSDEQILLLRVENIPDGAIIRVDGNEIAPDVDGKVRITLLNGLRELIDGTAIIEVKPPEDDSTDFQLTAVLEITEQDYEFEQGESPNEGIALKEIVGLVDINVRPVVEDDATIGIFDQSALDTPLTLIDAGADGKVSFTINNNNNEAGRYSVNMQDLDMSDNEGITNPPFELVEDLVVDFNTTDPVILDQLIVLGAVNNGDGTWVITDEDSFEILAPMVWFFQTLSRRSQT